MMYLPSIMKTLLNAVAARELDRPNWLSTLAERILSCHLRGA